MDNLSQFGAAGAIALVVFLFLKYLKEDAVRREQAYTLLAAAIEKQARATDKNTVATDINSATSGELRTFMTRLNGSLQRTVQEKQAMHQAEQDQP